MKFHGFQKMTMLDFPGSVACTVFTAGCNFRCPFCHNALLVTEIDNSTVYEEEEILAFLNKRKGVLDGICITGGEPLMNEGIFDFVKKVRKLGLLVKIDTNGSYPDRLKRLIDERLVDYVAMDIKNSPEKYNMTIACDDIDFSLIKRSIDLLLENSTEYEFRTTVVKELHESSDFEKIGELIKGAQRYYLQLFTDSGNLISQGFSAHEKEKMLEFKAISEKYVKTAELRGL